MILKAGCRHFYFILALLLMYHSSTTKAAFPLLPHNEAAVEHHRSQEGKNNQFRLVPAFAKRKADNEWQGIASFALALGALFCIGIISLTNSTTAFIAGLSASSLAVIFGIVGVRKRKKGFAIAGLALGMMEAMLLLALMTYLIFTFP